MTNAITTSASVSRSTGPALPQQGAGSALESFISLLDLGKGSQTVLGSPFGPSQTGALSSAAILPTQAALGETAQALGDRLAALLGDLEALTKRLEKGETLSQEDLANLQSMLESVEDLLEQAAPLEGMPHPLFALVAELGTGSSADGTSPFDRLAGLAARLADGLADQAPELAGRLSDFAKSLDMQSAALHAAASNETARAIGEQRKIESDAKLNPATAIADGQEVELSALKAPNDAKAARSETGEGSERTLVKAEAGAAGGTGANAQNSGANTNANANGGQSAATPPPPLGGEADPSETLAIQSVQAQSATSGAQGAARPEAAAYQRPEAQINLPHIAAEISRHVQNGVNRFEIRLNPPELGRIDVKLEMDNSGNVIARLAVEKSETLDLLQRDQRALMRALGDAGIDSAKTELDFSLQQDGEQQAGRDQSQASSHMLFTNVDTEPQNSPTIAEPSPYMRGFARLDAVNLWV